MAAQLVLHRNHQGGENCLSELAFQSVCLQMWMTPLPGENAETYVKRPPD